MRFRVRRSSLRIVSSTKVLTDLLNGLGARFATKVQLQDDHSIVVEIR